MPSAKAIAAATPGAVGFAEVPLEVLIMVARHLGGWELSRAVCVCREWCAALCGQGELWRAALERDFRESTPATKSDEVKFLRSQLSVIRRTIRPDERADRSFARRMHSYEDWAAATLNPNDRWYLDQLELDDLARIYMAGGPPVLQQTEAAALAQAHASGATPRASWRRVRVAERPKQAPDGRTILSWLRDLVEPYTLEWRNELGEGAVHKRRLLLHAPPCNRRRSPFPDYHMYRQMASALLHGRCRVCLRHTNARHPVLGVPMCAELQCAGTFPVVTAAAAARVLGAASAGGAVRVAKDAGAVVGQAKRRKRRGGADPQPVLLVSTVARLAAEAAAEQHSAKRAA